LSLKRVRETARIIFSISGSHGHCYSCWPIRLGGWQYARFCANLQWHSKRPWTTVWPGIQ
jgi:hypothetical protein